MLSTFKVRKKRRFSLISASSEPESHQTAKLYNHLMTSNHELLRTGQYSDFTVFCGSREFHLHRSIVCPQSSFFATALDGSFEEAGSKVITLREDDPAVVQSMLDYLYTSDYNEASKAATTQANGDSPSNHLLVDVDEYEGLAYYIRMYAIADKYDIKDLKTLAQSKFESSITGRWPIPLFPALVQEILVSTPSTDSGLRGLVTSICAQHITELLDGETTAEDLKNTGDNATTEPSKTPNFTHTLGKESTFTSAVLTEVARNSTKKSTEADAAYAGLSQEFETYKGKASKEIDGLKAKLQQVRKELNDCKDAMRAAGRQPLCCEGEGFLPTFSPGTSLSPPRLRLQCAACRKMYN